jgi:hypothetical protein
MDMIAGKTDQTLYQGHVIPVGTQDGLVKDHDIVALGLAIVKERQA